MYIGSSVSPHKLSEEFPSVLHVTTLATLERELGWSGGVAHLADLVSQSDSLHSVTSLRTIGLVFS